MIAKMYNDRLIFLTDDDDSKKYHDMIRSILSHGNRNDYHNLKIASMTGKYFNDNMYGECSVCGIMYNRTSNTLVWICPICRSPNVIDDENIRTTIKHKNREIVIKLNFD